MSCPICGQKAANCDCTATERAQHEALRDALAEIARLREERRWIPVARRLPDEGAIVLWSANDWSEHWPQCVGKRRGNGVNWGGDLDSEIEQFTHWQPLPPPPGEGEVEG